MEKIKLQNGMQIGITTNGILSTDTALEIKLSTELTVGEIDNLFSDPENTEKIELLSDNNEVLKIYNGYSHNSMISKDCEAGIITVKQCKQSDVEIRLEKLEQTQSVQDIAIMDIAMSIGGEA